MKRILFLLLSCTLVLALFAGCGTKQTETGATESVTAEAATPGDAISSPTSAPTQSATEQITSAPTEKPADGPAEDVSNALALSLAFDGTGNVSNGVAGGPEITPYQNSNIETLVDETAGKWASRMTGGTCFYIAPINDLYDRMANAFSLELFFNLTSAPSSGYWAIADNCEDGGFGMEIHPGSGSSDANLKWNIYIDSAYYVETIPVELNKWNHLITTWDGNFVRCFLNGELVTEYESFWGEIKFTSIETARHLAIGACCSANNSGGNGMVGLLSVCNLYTTAINSETARVLFENNTKADAEITQPGDATEAPATDVPSNPTEVPADATDVPTDKPTAVPEPTEKTDPGQVEDLSGSMIVSLSYDGDGNVSNGAKDGPAITTYKGGNIETVKDPDTGRWASHMLGGACFYMAPIGDYYDDLTEGFTLELYFKLESAPSSGYWAVADNCEDGGIGLEIHPGTAGKDCILKWNTYLDSQYDLREIKANLNEWNYFVATWDGNYVKCYLNGELVDEYESFWAELKFTSIETAQHLAIGACCSQNNSGGNGMVGYLSVCNLYSKPMNEATVKALYNNL